MQVLIAPLILTKKVSPYSSKNQSKVTLSARNSEENDSKKNS